jgi:hypothetical protein
VNDVVQERCVTHDDVVQEVMCDACSLILFESGVVVSIQQCEITDQRGASVVVRIVV